MKIVRTRLPGIEERLVRQVVGYVHTVRGLKLGKPPGVGETLDCAEALRVLGKTHLDEDAVRETLGCISKSVEDDAKIKNAGMSTFLVE
jgi:hypothetical protein